jgi:hypothetical protein
MKARVWVLLLWGGPAVVFGQQVGQPLGQFNAQSLEPSGWRVYSVSGSAAYYSVGLPYGYGSLPAGVPQQAAWGAGAAGNGGWTCIRENSSAAAFYTASYGTQAGFTGYRALNQRLSLGWQRRLRGRWSLSLTAEAGVATRDQYLYTPTDLGGSTSSEATFDDLAAIALGHYPDTELVFAQLGNGGVEPLVETLFGNRLFTGQFTNRLTYRQSERLSWNFTLSGTRLEDLAESGTSGEQSAGVISASTSVSAGARLQYLLTPRTTLNFEVSEMRLVSRIEDVYTMRAIAGISHTLSRRWLVEVHAGGSQVNPLRQTYELPSDWGYVAGGSLAFKTYSQTFVGSASRQLGDTYGLGAVNSLTGNARWTWQRPGNAWSTQAILSWRKWNGGANVEDWSLAGAVTRAMSAHISTQLAYVYLRFSRSDVPGILPAQSSVRASVTWYPREAHR